jgi:hypothetical protein
VVIRMMRKFFIALGVTLLAGAGLAVSQPFGPSSLLPTITDGATSIANAIKLTFSGCTVGGSSSNATVTCSGSGTGTVTNPHMARLLAARTARPTPKPSRR